MAKKMIRPTGSDPRDRGVISQHGVVQFKTASIAERQRSVIIHTVVIGKIDLIATTEDALDDHRPDLCVGRRRTTSENRAQDREFIERCD
ncbi:MAG: hypothetical protein ACLUEV_09225 [Alistipes sp.]